MSRPNVSDLVRALATPRASDGRVTYQGRVAMPPEIYINRLACWVREDGSWVSGWNSTYNRETGAQGREHYSFRPGFFARRRLQEACRRWEAKP